MNQLRVTLFQVFACEICSLAFTTPELKLQHEQGQLHRDVVTRFNVLYYNTYNPHANNIPNQYSDETDYNSNNAQFFQTNIPFSQYGNAYTYQQDIYNTNYFNDPYAASALANVIANLQYQSGNAGPYYS